MYKILVIEDESRVASILRKGLKEQGFEVKVAYDGYIGKKMLGSEHFDAVLLDVNLPGLNGYEVCKIIREENKQIPVLMLTALGAKDDMLSGFSSGADDYIIKPFDFKELVARLQVFLRRSGNQVEFAMRNQMSVADLTIYLDTKTVERAGQRIELTAKEFTLLEYFMRNENTYLSKNKIAGHVWNMSFDMETNIVEVYMNYLRKKIDKNFDKKLLKTKTGFGYCISAQDE